MSPKAPKAIHFPLQPLSSHFLVYLVICIIEFTINITTSQLKITTNLAHKNTTSRTNLLLGNTTNRYDFILGNTTNWYDFILENTTNQTKPPQVMVFSNTTTCGETCGVFALVKFTTQSPQVLSSVKRASQSGRIATEADREMPRNP